MSKRMETILKIKELEETKVNFENALNDINNSYFKSVVMVLQFDTEQYGYSRKYEGEQIAINEGLFREYITHEIQVLEDRINIAIAEL